ncbi:MAG: hypothetical protein JXQ73_23415 [Phycisphaerae bacterium]|nr:hypothetical protein [Phycisphaerae bacterium]
MTTSTRACRWTGILSFCGAIALAGLAVAEQAQPQAQPEDQATTLPSAGFWPTQRMLEIILTQGTQIIVQRYQFDPEQAAALRKDLLTRYPALLNEHRIRLQPVINEIIEMQLAGESPNAPQVGRIAERVQPFLDGARETLKATHETVRPLLRPGQRRIWDRDYVKLVAALAVAEAQLTRWKHGQFKKNDWPFKLAWDPTSQPAAASAATRPGEAPGGPEDHAAARDEIRPDRWQAYVKDFIRKHKLDQGQSHQATAILKDVRQRAVDYQKQNRDLFDQIKEELALAGVSRRETLQASLDELQQPLRDLFQELQTRLRAVLRSDQISDR